MSGPTPIPAPDPTPKPTYPHEDPPADYSTLTDTQKLDWLDKHGLLSDNTINLGDCYRRGSKLTHIFQIVFKVLSRVRDFVKSKGSAALKKYLNAFIVALNNGVGHLSNFIYDNVTTLLATGKFGDEAVALPPTQIPDLPVIGDDEPVTSSSSGKSFDTSFWGIFLDTLKVMIETWPWINQVHPPLDVSYAQLLEDVINTGQTFFKEFNKAGGDRAEDEFGTHIYLIVAEAVEDGSSRGIRSSSGDVPDVAAAEVSTIEELKELRELAPAWERIRY